MNLNESKINSVSFLPLCSTSDISIYWYSLLVTHYLTIEFGEISSLLSDVPHGELLTSYVI
jgi:hypothetical protein